MISYLLNNETIAGKRRRTWMAIAEGTVNGINFIEVRIIKINARRFEIGFYEHNPHCKGRWVDLLDGFPSLQDAKKHIKRYVKRSAA